MPTHFAKALPVLAMLLASGFAAGCVSSTQRVQIACVPEEMEVYVDGRLLEGDAAEGVVLRTDEPHKIYVKGEGYEPLLVVLEPTVDAEGRASLGPDEVCIDVVPVGMGRKLQIELEHDVIEESPAR